jgi:hypothetical protein
MLAPANKNGILPSGKQVYVLIPKFHGLTFTEEFKRKGNASVLVQRVAGNYEIFYFEWY